MNIKILEKNLKYLSLTLILSFFVLHKILFVFIGMILALYDLNKKYLSALYQKYDIKNDKEKTIEIKMMSIFDKKIINSDKVENNLSLAERVEELGFIPSIDKNNDNKAA